MPGRTLPPPDLLNGSNGAHEDGEENHNDSDSESEAPDATSTLVELSPDEFPTYFSERNGRLFHSGTSPYPLPVDTPEQTVRMAVEYTYGIVPELKSHFPRLAPQHHGWHTLSTHWGPLHRPSRRAPGISTRV